jgi:hypothetical protein
MALSDDQQMDRLETRVDRLEAKMEKGFSETRADFRMLLGVQLTTIVAMILGFAGIIVQHAWS